MTDRTHPMRVGILTVSDRASRGEYEDLSGPAIERFVKRAVTSPFECIRRVVPDGREPVRNALLELCDRDKAGLVLITGGTGPALRDETPEAMDDVIEKHLPGFGELMRRISLETVPTAILSRQGAGTRGATLMISLPGKPTAIDVCLAAVFPAVPYCLHLIGAGRLDTAPAVVDAFWPGG